MKPIQFKEQNKTLTKPKSMTDEECGSLPVFNDGETYISCWKAGLFNRIKFLFTGKIWLWVWSGRSQPPVCVTIKTPFNSSKSEK